MLPGPSGSEGGTNINQVLQEKTTPSGGNGLYNHNVRPVLNRINPTSVPYDGRGVSEYNAASYSGVSQESELRTPAVQRVQSGDHYDSAILSTPRNPGSDVNDTLNDDQILSTQNSAGLIFGNLVNNTTPFYPGIAGQDPLPFSDPSSLFMNDLWSVADGPWMIHGNFL
jgi:hypothetical protein